MESCIIRDSEQDMQGNVSHVCTVKASLDGTIHWLFLDIIEPNQKTALELGELLKRKRVSEYEKMAMGMIAALDIDAPVTFRKVTMDQHLKWLCDVISQSSYRLPLLGHSLDRDIDFMFASSDKFFKGHPLKCPGDQRASWQRIIKVCTQRLLTNCHLTFRKANPDAKWGSATMETLTMSLLGREQKHNAVSDVLDLLEILKIAKALDHFKLPKENFLIIKPCNQVETSAA
jgi:hypothetical protein